MLLRFPAVVAAAAALALPAASTAHADAPWSAPTAISGATGQSAPLITTRAGRSVVLAGANSATTAGSELVPLSADGRPARTPVGLPIAAGQLGTYAADRVVVAGSTIDPRDGISARSH